MLKDNFQSLADNRIEFMKRIVFDDEVAKCLLNKSPNFKSTTVTQLEKASLMYSQVFPFSKTTNTLVDTKAYITMKFQYKKTNKLNIFKIASVTFYVFCHESIITTPYAVLRSDFLLSQIDRLMNDTESTNDGWIGKLSLSKMDDIIMDSEGKYIGLAVTYTDMEFQ